MPFLILLDEAMHERMEGDIIPRGPDFCPEAFTAGQQNGHLQLFAQVIDDGRHVIADN